ncbi:DUF2378 family protein [Myxococcaceae bacterium GXIMD 01537]
MEFPLLSEPHAFRPLRPTSAPVRRIPVVFGPALELLLAEAGHLGPSTLQALGRLGLTPRASLDAAYAAAVWPAAIRILADATNQDPARAEFVLGQRFMERALRSRMGVAMSAHARAVGPERTLARLSHHLRALNNFMDASVRERSLGGGWDVTLRPLPEFACLGAAASEPPHFTRGVLTTGFHASGVPGVRVDVVRQDTVLGSASFRVGFYF